MIQMYSASQLRQIHEERIAPYIQGNEVEKPQENTPKVSRWNFNLLKQVKKATQS